MKHWKNKQFEKWKNIRRKGCRHYVLKYSLFVSGGVLFGNFVGFVLFDKVRTWDEFRVDIGIATLTLLIVAPVMNYFMWFISESMYQKECKNRDRT
jgi:hypothetical protein